jgi:putative transposase
MIYGFMDAQKAVFPIRLMCRRLGVSPAGFYEWQTRQVDRSPRVRADLRLGAGIRVGRKRVERLMRQDGLQGRYWPRRRGCARRNPAERPAEDLVHRRFRPGGPNRLWVADITEHPTREGKVYLAAVIDAWSRRVVGWSIADHLRAELVSDALDMATWRRKPKPGETVHHADHGCQHTSWAFGQRLRRAGLLGSMDSVSDTLDNAVAESFFGTLQLELLDSRRWDTRRQLAQAFFEWTEAWYNPARRHSFIGNHSPVGYEHTATQEVASSANPTRPGKRGKLRTRLASPE